MPDELDELASVNPKMAGLIREQDDAVGNPYWRQPDAPLEDRVNNYLSTRARQSTTAMGGFGQEQWSGMTTEMDRLFPGLDPSKLYPAFATMQSIHQGQKDVEAARGLYKDRDWEQGFAGKAGFVAERAVPVGSAVYQFGKGMVYKDARERLAKGEAEKGDAELVAKYEAQQEAESKYGLGKQIAAGVLHVPAIVGEAALGGAGLKALGVAPTIALGGRGAAAVAEAAPWTLRATAAAAPAYLGRTAAQTLLMPTMYLPQTSQQAIRNGGDWNDLQNLGPAYAMGMMQVAVLGSISQVGQSAAAAELFPVLARSGAAPYFARLFASVGTGMTGQQVVDATNGIITAAVPKWGHPGFGIMGDLLEGKGDDALKHAAVQAATFAAFGLMHAHNNPVGVARAKEAMEAKTLEPFTRYLETMRRTGRGAVVTGKEALEVHQRLMDRIQGDTLDLSGLSKPAQTYAKDMADALDVDTLAKEQQAKGKIGEAEVQKTYDQQRAEQADEFDRMAAEAEANAQTDTARQYREQAKAHRTPQTAPDATSPPPAAELPPEAPKAPESQITPPEAKVEAPAEKTARDRANEAETLSKEAMGRWASARDALRRLSSNPTENTPERQAQAEKAVRQAETAYNRTLRDLDQRRTEAAAEDAAKPKVAKPGSPESTAEGITKVFGDLGKGIHDAADAKADEYAQRILKGEKDVLQGLNPEGAFAKKVMARVAELKVPEAPAERRGDTLTIGKGEDVGADYAGRPLYRHSVTTPDGKEAGGVLVAPEGDVLHIKIAQGEFGLGAWRGLLRSLGESYPEAKTVEFQRTTGPNAGKVQRIPIGRGARGQTPAPESADPFEAPGLAGLRRPAPEVPRGTPEPVKAPELTPEQFKAEHPELFKQSRVLKGEGEVPAHIADVLDGADLTPREKFILAQLARGNSHEAVAADPAFPGRKLGERPLSRQRVQQIEVQAMQKLGLEPKTMKAWTDATAEQAAKGINFIDPDTMAKLAEDKTSSLEKISTDPEAQRSLGLTEEQINDRDEIERQLQNLAPTPEEMNAIDRIGRIARDHHIDEASVRRGIERALQESLAASGIALAPEATPRPTAEGRTGPAETPSTERSEARSNKLGISSDEVTRQKLAAKAEADAAKAEAQLGRLSPKMQLVRRTETELGLKADDLHAAAKDIAKENAESVDAENRMLKDARERLDKFTNLHRQGKEAMQRKAEDWMDGLDEVAPLIAEEWGRPDITPAKLMDLIHRGNLTRLTETEAYQQAFEQIQWQKEASDAAREAERLGLSAKAAQEAVRSGAEVGEAEPQAEGRGAEPPAGEVAPGGHDFDPSTFGEPEPAKPGRLGARVAPTSMGAATFSPAGPEPPPGTPEAAVMTPPRLPPKPSQSWFRSAVDFLKSFGQQSFPALTRLSRESGEQLARASNARWAAKSAYDYYANDLMVAGKRLGRLPDGDKVELGTTWGEMRFRYYREVLNDMIAKEADLVKKAALTQTRDNIVTVVGTKGSPLQTEAQYQQNVADLWSFFEAIKQEWTKEVEANYRDLKGLDPFDAIDSTTQIPGLPLNLIAVNPEAPGAVQAGVRSPGMGGLNIRKPGFTRQAGLNAEAYDLNIENMMRHTLERGIEASSRAKFVRQAIEDGVIEAVKPGKKASDGFKELGLRTARGLEGLDPNSRYYIHPEAFRDVVQGLNIGERPAAQVASGLRPFTNVVYNVALMAPVELMTHIGNQFTAMFRPGMGNPLFAMGRSLRSAYRVWNADPVTLEKVKDLARMSASFGHEARPGLLRTTTELGKFIPGVKPEAVERIGERLGKGDPTTYINRFTSGLIDVLQKGVRLQLAEAFDRVAERDGFEKTETNKRDFINQALGNYNTQASSRVAQFLKDSGLQSFATAAHTFTAQGIKSLWGGAINAKTTGWRSEVALRSIAVLKLAPVLALGPALNYAMWGNAFPKDVPVFAIKLDSDDKKAHYVDPLAFTGIRRGAKATLIHAPIEAMLHQTGETGGQIRDKAIDDALLSIEHLFEGPPAQFLHTAATGRDVFGRQVAATPSKATTPQGIAKAAAAGKPPLGSSQYDENLKAALIGVNPIVKTVYGEKKPREWWENVAQSLGPFGIKTRDKPAGKLGARTKGR